MMETKLWFYLCALLVIHLGSAEHDNDDLAHNNASHDDEVDRGAAVSDLGLDSVNSSATSPNGTDGLTSNATTDEEPNIMTFKPVEYEGISVNLTNESPSELPVVTSDTPSPPSHPPPITSTTDGVNTSSVDAAQTPAPSPDYNASHNDTHPQQTDPTINVGNQSGDPTTASPTSAPAPKTSTATSGSHSSSTSGSISPHRPSSSQTSVTPYDLRPETTGAAQPGSTSSLSNSPPTQAKPHPDNPPQLNVHGEDPVVRHDSPTLDPLLAGLVSAFIITAVIITLLLFLKLRRRDNRPEFRRLQDLPMDDMMEDTSLTMYSY